MRPFFSIVIPTLNEEKYLPKLLTDLVNQSEKNFEVIVADSVSSDKTKESALVFKDRLDLDFIQYPKKNVASQRNNGANYSKGDFLVFLDADARIKSNFLKKVKNNILKKKGLLFIPFLSPEKVDKDYSLLFDFANLMAEFSHVLKTKFSLGGSFIIERNFFKLIGGFDEKLFLAEDHELIQRVSVWGVDSKFLHDAKIDFSLRRWKREGNLSLMYKHIVATAYRLFGKEIKDKIFDYQMGGKDYFDLKKKKHHEAHLIDYKKMIRKFKKLGSSFIKEFS